MLGPKGFDKLDQYFRTELGIDLTKETIELLLNSVKATFGKLFHGAQQRARWNGRDFIALADLNITKALEEHIKNFQKIEQDMGVDELLEYISFIPPVEMDVGEDLKSEYRNIMGGLLLMHADVIKKATGERKPSREAMEFVAQIVDKVF